MVVATFGGGFLTEAGKFLFPEDLPAKATIVPGGEVIPASQDAANPTDACLALAKRLTAIVGWRR